jgi:transcriptional regulator with XRE-family HTH domain
MEDLIAQLDIYAQEHSLSKREVADELGVSDLTFSRWLKGTQKPSKLNVDRMEAFLEGKEKPEIEEARRKTEKIKYLLILLEDELRWFRDNSPQSREIFRRELEASDIGYISSLLTMLTEEDKFKRWLALTTTQFHSFKRR